MKKSGLSLILLLQIHVQNGEILPKENQCFLFNSDALGSYKINIDLSLLEDDRHCRRV